MKDLKSLSVKMNENNTLGNKQCNSMENIKFTKCTFYGLYYFVSSLDEHQRKVRSSKVNININMIVIIIQYIKAMINSISKEYFLNKFNIFGGLKNSRTGTIT